MKLICDKDPKLGISSYYGYYVRAAQAAERIVKIVEEYDPAYVPLLESFKLYVSYGEYGGQKMIVRPTYTLKVSIGTASRGLQLYDRFIGRQTKNPTAKEIAEAFAARKDLSSGSVLFEDSDLMGMLREVIALARVEKSETKKMLETFDKLQLMNS